jgi:hypothetical protein
MTTFNIGDIAAQADRPSKIQIPGIYSGFKITKCELTEKYMELEFFATDINKMHELRLYTTANADWQGNPRSAEDTAKAESKIIAKLIEVCRAVGDIKDLESLTGDYKTLLVKLFKYIETKAPKAQVNLKIHQAGDWTKVSSNLGSIEKHIPGQDPKLYFTPWEIDQKWNIPATSSPSTTSFTSSSSTSTSSIHSAPAANEADLPF